jgi:hypothetical protein
MEYEKVGSPSVIEAMPAGIIQSTINAMIRRIVTILFFMLLSSFPVVFY